VNSISKAFLIHIRGLVQGVGFRPFIYRIAINNKIRGWVENNNEGVSIHAEGSDNQIDNFIKDISSQAPQAASIHSLQKTEVPFQRFKDFIIQKSSSFSESITEVSPDIAVCDECLEDLKSQKHRIGYPFINCTNCGPRFTIIRDLPYDRHLTSMEPFEMCGNCRAEYENILDRRFHAQPVACNHCGPEYRILKPVQSDNNDSISEFIAKMIDAGKIVALKGMGGFHFVCDGHNELAVQTMRQRKHRDRKPFALMCRDYKTVCKYVTVNPSEKKSLISWRRPVVLLHNHEHSFAASVSYGLPSTGIVMPYMPIHYQIFDHLLTDSVIFTSGNLSDEPVCIDDSIALDELTQVADIVIGYNREIHNRTDDSVVMVVNDRERMIRRSRGFVPSPIQSSLNTEGIFAAGAELTNTFALGKGTQIIFSQHIGDLQNAETLAFYEESVERFSRLFRFHLQAVAFDMHPSYLSTVFAKKLNVPHFEIQHHHAHIASCMAEHGLDENVIGFAFDGTGLGDDGTIWGGEVFTCDLSDYERKYFFDPVPLPGGDQVTKYPWRTAVSYIYKYFGEAKLHSGLPFLDKIDPKDLVFITQMIDSGLNVPKSSGAGRLFDAVAAITGICPVSSFHAEAPMRLEAAIESNCKGRYLYMIDNKCIVFYKTFQQILNDFEQKVSVGKISAKFHNTIISLILDLSRKIRTETGLNKVVLSGGTFQNRYLLSLSENLLKDQDFEVFTHETVPSNDGGLALGQLAIAAKRREKMNEK
jgi:hydrogenase maturation protein HypF